MWYNSVTFNEKGINKIINEFAITISKISLINKSNIK